MMEAVQIDFFGTLDRESDTRKPNLCRTWENETFDYEAETPKG